MNQTTWQKIEELFNTTLELPICEREQFLTISCAGNEALKNEILSLLAKTDAEDSFLEKPVLPLGMVLLDEKRDESFIGKEIGRYKIIKLLGKGGMGRVYLAQDLSLNRLVALKLLLEYLVKDEESVGRFQKEARAASAVSHPNIAHIYEANIENKQRFIAMEYIDGITLRDLLKQKELDSLTIVEIVLQIANALTAAHSAGIIHRDIKPENIMLRTDGFVKVLDFGIAKSLGVQTKQPTENSAKMLSVNITSELLLGTMAYISPEQLKNRVVDFRTDIWSLGIVLYEMLAGRKPFEEESPEKIGEAILTKNPAPLSFPHIAQENELSLKRIVAKMLQKEAIKRYESSAEIAFELKELKQSLEFNRQFLTDKVLANKTLPVEFNTGEQIKSFTFLTRTRQFWNHQTLSRKALTLIALIGLVMFGVALRARDFRNFYTTSQLNSKFFSPDSRGRLQISTLFSNRRKPNGDITDLSFSPDGKSIVFAVSGDGLSDIYVKNTEHGEPVKITDGKWLNRSPLWSLDGRRIAFVSDRDNKAGIWTVSYAGADLRFEVSLEDMGLTCFLRKWSNNGKRIYYENCKKLYAIELASGEVSEIELAVAEAAGSFNISLDEKMLTFVAIANKTQQIFTQSLETGEVKDVSKTKHHNWSPVFFPDNQRIAYSSDQNGISQIYITDLSGSETSQITFGDISASFPVVSPDGSKIIYVSQMNEANIFSFDLRTNREVRQTSNTQMQLFPNISPNKDRMVFQSTDNETKVYSSILKIKNLETDSEPNQITLNGGEPQWSPQNNEIAYLNQSDIDINIWKIQADGTKKRQLTFGGIFDEGIRLAPVNLMSIPFDWSPDGKKIVYSSRQSGFCNIWTIDNEGGSPEMLTNNTDSDVRLSSALWSPEGDRIANVYRKMLKARNSQYGITVLSNGKSKNLFESPLPIRLLGWLPNKNEMLAAVGNENNVEIVKISANVATKPLVIANLEGVYTDGIILSPDGEKIAYAARRNGIGNIFLFSGDDKEVQLTLNLENTLYYSGITWSSDSNSLYYSKQSGGMQISMISDSFQ